MYEQAAESSTKQTVTKRDKEAFKACSFCPSFILLIRHPILNTLFPMLTFFPIYVSYACAGSSLVYVLSFDSDRIRFFFVCFFGPSFRWKSNWRQVWWRREAPSVGVLCIAVLAIWRQISCLFYVTGTSPMHFTVHSVLRCSCVRGYEILVMRQIAICICVPKR